MLKRWILMTLAGGSVFAALAATSTGASNGAIHLYETSNRGPRAPGTVVITGAVNDGGIGYATGNATGPGAIKLSKGSIKDAPSSTFISREEDLFGTAVKPPGCALEGTITGPVKIIGGTGAYAGITGTVNATYTVAAVLPERSNGTCNQTHKVRPIGVAIFVRASGNVSFR